MKRRKFIASGAALGLAGYAPFAQAGTTKRSGQTYIELIRYTLFTGRKKNMVKNFYRDVAIRALNKAGVSPVGVFDVKYGENAPYLYVLLQHDSLESFASYPQKLMQDKDYVKNGKEFLEAPFNDPAYVRKESKLMRSFRNMPEVEVPKKMVGKDHILEMRIYESHNYNFAQKKIHMFNEGGEIDIFRKTGLSPVFFGETVAGPSMPNLTYMVAFKDMEARDKNWKVFVDSPEWNKLKKDTYYKDTVSNITDIILRPAPFSQI